jgi:hypothetical protein
MLNSHGLSPPHLIQPRVIDQFLKEAGAVQVVALPTVPGQPRINGLACHPFLAKNRARRAVVEEARRTVSGLQLFTGHGSSAVGVSGKIVAGLVRQDLAC